MLATHALKSSRTPKFPKVSGFNSSKVTDEKTTFNITLPSGVEKDDLLLIAQTFVGVSAGATATVPAGWTAVTDIDNYMAVYRVSDGSEGSSVAFTYDIASITVANSVRIGRNTYIGNPEETHNTGSNGLPDPPSHTASWGALNNLWIAFGSNFRNAQLTIDGIPSGFTNGTNLNSDHDHTASDLNQASAQKEDAVATLNPGTFAASSTSSTTDWSSTFVIRGAQY